MFPQSLIGISVPPIPQKGLLSIRGNIPLGGCRTGQSVGEVR